MCKRIAAAQGLWVASGGFAANGGDEHAAGCEGRSFTGDLDRGAWFAVMSRGRSPQIVPAEGPLEAS